MLSVKMRLLLLVIAFYTANAVSIRRTSDSTNQLKDDSKGSKLHSTTTATSPAPAIIAIEIVNAPKNSSQTEKNTSKRTIESSLGYGYQNTYDNEQHKKFMIYKYSQENIPSSSYYLQSNDYSNQVEIQKSLEKHIEPTDEYVQPTEPKLSRPVYGVPENAYYNPGNIVYTTLSNHGQLGGLSTQVPYQNIRHAQIVPVILLRVYSDQLDNSQVPLHTSLPQTNPYAGLNNINLQSILQNYVHQSLQNQQPIARYQILNNYQPYYQPQLRYNDEYYEQQLALPTSENYPSEQHTRVIFHSNNNGHIPVPNTMFRTPGLSRYKTVTVPKYVAPVSNDQYEYSYNPQQNLQQQYMYVYPVQYDQNVNYQETQQSYEQQEQQYQIPENNQPNYNSHSIQLNNVQPETEEHTSRAYNYHVHTDAPSKSRRSQSQAIEVSSTLPPKRREPRNKSE